MQFRMLLFFNQHNQIPIGAPTLSCIASSSNTQLHAFLNACRNINRHRFFAIHSSFSFANSTFRRNRRSFSITSWASSNSLHLPKECICDSSHLPAATTGSASLHTAFVFRTAAATCVATDVFFYLDIFGNPFRNFLVIEFYFDAQVAAANSSCSCAATTTSSSATKKTSENIITKNITELAEDIIHIATAAESTTTIINTCMTIAVILRFFISVAQYFIIFSSFITGISIRMILHCYFAISFFYLVGRCAF